MNGDRLLASGSDSVRRLAESVAARGVLEFRPVLALVPPEQTTPILADSPAPVLPSRSGASSAVRYAVVQSAPSFRTPSFSGSVQISGNFTEPEAEAIAAALDTGAYPVAVRLV